MQTTVNQTFQKQTVRLDGNRFVGCRFVQCTVEFGAEDSVGLDGCMFEDCNWTFVEYAGSTVSFLKKLSDIHGGRDLIIDTFLK